MTGVATTMKVSCGPNRIFVPDLSVSRSRAQVLVSRLTRLPSLTCIPFRTSRCSPVTSAVPTGRDPPSPSRMNSWQRKERCPRSRRTRVGRWQHHCYQTFLWVLRSFQIRFILRSRVHQSDNSPTCDHLPKCRRAAGTPLHPFKRKQHGHQTRITLQR